MFILIAAAFAAAFTIIELAAPGSFEGIDPGGDVRVELTYFSFVTLTTLGYGDIVPTNQLARALATGEAIVGQVYLGVFVASLVGLHLADRREERGQP